MQCKCGEEMELVRADDLNQAGPDKDFTYNLYACDCGTVLKEDVYNRKKVWVNTQSEVVVEGNK